MYINVFWIFVIAAVLIILFVRQHAELSRLKTGYSEQREITSMYINIARSSLHPKKLAENLVMYLINAEISHDNVYSIFTAWGVSPEIANVLSYPGNEQLKDDARLLAVEQILEGV